MSVRRRALKYAVVLLMAFIIVRTLFYLYSVRLDSIYVSRFGDGTPMQLRVIDRDDAYKLVASPAYVAFLSKHNYVYEDGGPDARPWRDITFEELRAEILSISESPGEELVDLNMSYLRVGIIREEVFSIVGKYLQEASEENDAGGVRRALDSLVTFGKLVIRDKSSLYVFGRPRYWQGFVDLLCKIRRSNELDGIVYEYLQIAEEGILESLRVDVRNEIRLRIEALWVWEPSDEAFLVPRDSSCYVIVLCAVHWCWYKCLSPIYVVANKLRRLEVIEEQEKYFMDSSVPYENEEEWKHLRGDYLATLHCYDEPRFSVSSLNRALRKIRSY